MLWSQVSLQPWPDPGGRALERKSSLRVVRPGAEGTGRVRQSLAKQPAPARTALAAPEDVAQRDKGDLACPARERQGGELT